MPDYAEQLRDELVQIQETGGFGVQSVSYVMSLSRQLLESTNLKREYQHLNLYCNWTLHAKLQKSAFADQILERISNEFSSPEVKEYNDVILGIIGLQYLRQDFLSVYSSHHIPTFLFESKSAWKGFIEVLIGLLLDKPLKRRSSSEISKVRQEDPTYAIELRLGRKITDTAFESIRVQARENPNKMAMFEVYPDIWWIVEVAKPGIIITGPFNLPEPDSAFKIR